MIPAETSSASRIKTGYFPALTGIRAIAAAMVYFVHYNPVPPGALGGWLFRFTGEFHTGVTIFFVLSGFLICHRYQDALSAGSADRKWLWNYWVNRFGRIYPVYFLATWVSVIPWLFPSRPPAGWQVLLLNFSFLRGFFDEYKFTGAPAGWSMTVEEMFYLLFPLIIFSAPRARLWSQPLFFLASGILLTLIFRRIPFHGFFASPAFLFEFTFFGRCIEFYTGIALARYLHNRLPGPDPHAIPRTSLGITWIAICIAGLAVNRYLNGAQPAFLICETLINNFLLPPGIALLFYGLIIEKSIVRSALSSPPMILLGKSSYVFYLFHNMIFGRLYDLMGYKPIPVFILIQLISIVLYLSFERPLNQLIRRRLTIGAPAL